MRARLFSQLSNKVDPIFRYAQKFEMKTSPQNIKFTTLCGWAERVEINEFYMNHNFDCNQTQAGSAEAEKCFSWSSSKFIY